MATEISQGPWTRIRPLQRDEMDPYTLAGVNVAENVWGMRNNLSKTMAHVPKLAQTVIEYVNGILFDPVTTRGDVQEAGFNDRFLKELVISRTALLKRSRFAVTHHAMMGMLLFDEADRRDEGHQKLLMLHEYEKHPDVYTERERVVLDFTVQVATDPHAVTDEEFDNVRRVLREFNAQDERLQSFSDEDMSKHVDSQMVELVWVIGHFCLLSCVYSTLQIPDEGPDDEDNFQELYEDIVPADMRQRNEEVLGDAF